MTDAERLVRELAFMPAAGVYVEIVMKARVLVDQWETKKLEIIRLEDGNAD